MKKLIFKIAIVFIPILCLSTQCKKEGPNCHYSFNFENNSTDTVVFAFKEIYSTSDSCRFGGYKLPSNTIFAYDWRGCWEDILDNGRTFKFYIIDNNHFNERNVWYVCDSLEIKNTILEHYVITLEYLQETDFTISYP